MPDPIGAMLAVYDSLPPDVHLVILGGLAANAFRVEPRLTLDADLLIVSDVQTASSIDRLLLAAGFKPPPGR